MHYHANRNTGREFCRGPFAGTGRKNLYTYESSAPAGLKNNELKGAIIYEKDSKKTDFRFALHAALPERAFPVRERIG